MRTTQNWAQVAHGKIPLTQTQAMSQLIKEEVVVSDNNLDNQAILDGRYDLTGYDGDIILPRFWETLVLPRSTIVLKIRESAPGKDEENSARDVGATGQHHGPTGC